VPISVDEAMSAYGFVYALAKNIPELNTYLTQAVQGGWSADKLTATIESSTWWRSNADTVRNLVTMRATDPATYAQNVANARRFITLKAQQLGRTVDPRRLDALVMQSLVTNGSWDDQVLTNLVATNSTLSSGEALKGTAADLRNHMTQLAQSYGVAYTSSSLDTWTTRIQAGQDSLAGFEATMRARAKAAYPQFANQLDAGMTVRDIADPYIATMAQTLELDEGSLSLKDRQIQQALNQKDPTTGAQTAQPMWAFQQALKHDPRYDKTIQAKDDAFSTLAKIGADFGFTGAK